INTSARDRLADAMIILPDRIDRIGERRIGLTVAEGLASFADIPAVISAFLNDVDLFPQFLADIADPEKAGCFIERDSQRISDAICIDFWTRASDVDKRVVSRDAILAITAGRIDIDAEDRTEQRRQVLTIGMRVIAQPAVSETDV